MGRTWIFGLTIPKTIRQFTKWGNQDFRNAYVERDPKQVENYCFTISEILTSKLISPRIIVGDFNMLNAKASYRF